MAVDRHLVFRVARTQDRHLVLGLSESLEATKELQVNATFPALALAIDLDYDAPVISYDLTVNAAFPDLAFAIEVDYTLDVPNYLTAILGTPWQSAERVNDQQHALPWQAAARTVAPFALPWHSGQPVSTEFALPWHQSQKVNPPGVSLPWHSAQPVNPEGVSLPWQQGRPIGRTVSFPWHDGKPVLRPWALPWRAGKRTVRSVALPWQDGGRMVSYGGPPIVPEPPIEPTDPCYIPNRHLVIAEPHGDRHLVFICELHPFPGGTIVVPIKKVYKVINDTSLIRVSDGLAIPTYGVSISLDWQSWTWSFSANLPGAEYDHIKPDVDGTPVELELSINGYQFRFLAESLSTDRSFGRKDLRVGGRGKNAILDAPYAPFLTFDNSDGDRTAAQLMDEALMINEVPIGWTVEFDINDWLVTSGAWVHQGTHMSAVSAIAAAAGGYVQPHATDDTLIILPKYPFLPRDWMTDVVPDYELPAAVTVQEGMTWTEKPRYTRVFVSGTSQGVLGQITITGEAGDLVAPTVNDPLATQAAMVEQRGRSILGDTGRINMVSLRLPVLELTGVIVPGKFVDYVDGMVTKRGIVRSVSVEIGFPQVWQTITVETHE